MTRGSLSKAVSEYFFRTRRGDDTLQPSKVVRRHHVRLASVKSKAVCWRTESQQSHDACGALSLTRRGDEDAQKEHSEFCKHMVLHGTYRARTRQAALALLSSCILTSHHITPHLSHDWIGVSTGRCALKRRHETFRCYHGFVQRRGTAAWYSSVVQQRSTTAWYNGVVQWFLWRLHCTTAARAARSAYARTCSYSRCRSCNE